MPFKNNDLEVIKKKNVGNDIDSITKISEQLNDMATYNIKNGDKKYKIVAGTVRNTGTGWQFIVDDDHQTDLNCISVSADATNVIVNYSGLNVKKVVSFIVAPDETLATLGYTCGASVGKNEAYLRMYKPKAYGVGGIITCDGTTFTADVSAIGISSLEWQSANTKLRINHTSMRSYGALTSPPIILPYQTGNFIPRIAGLLTSATDIEFFDYAGNKITTLSNQLSLVFKRTSLVEFTTELVNPTTFTSASGNLWFIGVFEV